jgi:hypothetical protein
VNAPLEDLLLAVAAVGLAGSMWELPHEELPEYEAHALVAATERHHIAGVALASAQTEALRLPASAIEALAEVHVREMTTCLQLEHELLAVGALLDTSGIEFRVLGGSAAAHLDYPDPALRAFPMLELLIRPADLDRTVLLLRGDGWRQATSGEGGAARDSTTTLRGPGGVRLHLRTTIGPGPRGRPSVLQKLWEDGQEFGLAGRSLTALGREQRVVEASWHATAVDSPTALVSQRDLAEMVLFGDWNHTRLMRLAASWNALAVLAEAVRSTWQQLAIADVTGLSVWARGFRPAVGSQQPGLASVVGTDWRRPGVPWGRLRKLSRRS